MAAARDKAAARMRLGNISPKSNPYHRLPHEHPKKNTYRFADTRATVPARPDNTGCPVSGLTFAAPKITAMAARVTAHANGTD